MQLDHVVLSGIMHSIPTTGLHLKRVGKRKWNPPRPNGWAGLVEREVVHGSVTNDDVQ